MAVIRSNRGNTIGAVRNNSRNPLNNANVANSRGETLRKEAFIAVETNTRVKNVNSDVAELVVKQTRTQGNRNVIPVVVDVPLETGGYKPPNRSNASEGSGNTRGEGVIRSAETAGVRTNPDGSKTLFTSGPRITRSDNPTDVRNTTSTNSIRSSSPITSGQQIRDMQENPELYQQTGMNFPQGGAMSSLPFMWVLIGAGVLLLFNILSKRKK